MPRPSLIFIIMLCGFYAASAQTKQAARQSRGERLISALVDSKHVAGVYGDDGMYIFTPEPEIQRIFALKEKAIPLLIAHLDDTRLLNVGTNYADANGDRWTVTVGAACFDLLTLIIRREARFFDLACLKEPDEGTVGSCAKPVYALTPEDFWRGKKLRVSRHVRRVKQNWLNAYRRHEVHYQRFE